MMILPKFEDPNPSIDWLRSENIRLKNQADKMLEHTKILDVLAKYGKVTDIGGSYLYDLMVYPDLDLGIIANQVNDKLIAKLISDLVRHKNVRGINLVDTYHFGHVKSGRPDGYWIGLEIPYEGDRWGVDCWFQQPDWIKKDGGSNSNEDSYYIKLSNLSQEARDSILNMKYQLIYRGLYGKKYYSGQVYDAVIKNGTLSIDQFLSLSQ